MAKYYKEKNENVGSEIYSRRINDLLFEKQITQEELAKETGVSKPTISAWIMGKYEPKIKGLKSKKYWKNDEYFVLIMYFCKLNAVKC